MYRYIRAVTLTDSEIMSRFRDIGLDTARDPRHAIYLLRDGSMISGFMEGVRSEDHRCAECLLDDTDRYDPKFWHKLLEATGMILLHPETDTAMMLYGQHITPEQEAVLDELSYVIDYL